MGANIFKKSKGRQWTPEQKEKARRTGFISRAEGLGFQTMLENQFRISGFMVIQIPEGCKTIRSGYRGLPKIVRVKTPFDFVLTKQNGILPPITGFFDAKCCGADRFFFSWLPDHQVEILKELCRMGFKAGFIVYFKPQNKVCFFTADGLAKKESYGPEDGLWLGPYYQLNLKGFL